MSIMCLILFTSPSNTPLNPPAHPPFNFRSSFYLYNSMSPVGTSHGAWVQGQLLDDGQPMTTHGEKDDCAFSNSCGPLSGTWAQQAGQAIEFQEPTRFHLHSTLDYKYRKSYLVLPWEAGNRTQVLIPYSKHFTHTLS